VAAMTAGWATGAAERIAFRCLCFFLAWAGRVGGVGVSLLGLGPARGAGCAIGTAGLTTGALAAGKAKAAGMGGDGAAGTTVPPRPFALISSQVRDLRLWGSSPTGRNGSLAATRNTRQARPARSGRA